MSKTKRPVFAGNWKLYGTVAESLALAGSVRAALEGVRDAEVIVAPGFVALTSVVRHLEGSAIGVAGQDCFWESQGAFTGEVAAGQLADAGCKFVILGHSERRQFFGDDDAGVSRKVRAVLRAGLSPIVCVGETLAERDGGTTLVRVGAQLDAAINELADVELRRCLIAYEPVWAIGTGRTATPAQAQEVHRFIRTRLSQRHPTAASDVSILYGGSVKPDNIRALMAEEDIDGALVGGASLSAESFVRIVNEGTDVWLRS